MLQEQQLQADSVVCNLLLLEQYTCTNLVHTRKRLHLSYLCKVQLNTLP